MSTWTVTLTNDDAFSVDADSIESDDSSNLYFRKGDEDVAVVSRHTFSHASREPDQAAKAGAYSGSAGSHDYGININSVTVEDFGDKLRQFIGYMDRAPQIAALRWADRQAITTRSI